MSTLGAASLGAWADSTVAATSPYRDARISILTRHGKERVVAPLFRDVLDARVELARGFDTDVLGTFTGEAPRVGNQLEAAVRKATIGADLLGTPYGVASEGSFGHKPWGIFAWNVEIVVLVDRVRGIEIVGRAAGPAVHMRARVTTRDELERFAREVAFPAHGLVLRAEGDESSMIKGVDGWRALERAFACALARSSTVVVDVDLRAHMNATRRKRIQQATRDLLLRASTPCPTCRLPGYGVVEPVPGLPCRACGAPTREPRAERWRCAGGAHEEIRALPSAPVAADPYRCDGCNP